MLLSMAAEGVFLPLWSSVMWDEWERVVGDYLTAGVSNPVASSSVRRDLHDDRLTIHRDFPRSGVTDALPLCPSDLSLPDPGDWHVLATAIAADALVIVTENLKDFPHDILFRFRLSACSLDEFCVGLLQSSSDGGGDRSNAIYSALMRHRGTLKRPHAC